MITNEEIITKYIEHYKGSKESQSTRKSALNYFFEAKYFGYEGHVFKIDTQIIMGYFEHLNNLQLSFNTKRLKFAIFKSFLNYTMFYYEKEGFIVPLPPSSLTRWNVKNHNDKVQREILTIDEAQKFLLYVKRANFKLYLMYRILAETGMRKGELLSLTVSKCNLEKRYLDVSGKKGRKIYYMSEQLTKYLSIYITERNKLNTDRDVLFVSSHGNQYSKKFINVKLHGDKYSKGLLVLVGITKNISAQSFRKGLNTYRKKLGCSNEDRKILLNHKTSDVNIEHYLELNYQEYLSMFDKWNPFQTINI